jgi:hypothetical protein
LKTLLPIIKKEIESSYWADKEDGITEKVFADLESMQHLNKEEILNKIGKRPRPSFDELIEWNLYAIAWRIIERSMDYPFQKGDVVLFANRTYTIKSIKLETRQAELNTGTLVPLCSLKMKNSIIEPLAEPQQLSLF